MSDLVNGLILKRYLGFMAGLLFFMQVSCAKKQLLEVPKSPQVEKNASVQKEENPPIKSVIEKISYLRYKKELSVQKVGPGRKLVNITNENNQSTPWEQPGTFFQSNLDTFALINQGVLNIYRVSDLKNIASWPIKKDSLINSVSLSPGNQYLAYHAGNEIFIVDLTKKIELITSRLDGPVLSFQWGGTKLAIIYRFDQWKMEAGTHGAVAYGMQIVDLVDTKNRILSDWMHVAYKPGTEPCVVTSQNYSLKCPVGESKFLTLFNVCGETCSVSLMKEKEFPSKISFAALDTSEKSVIVMGPSGNLFEGVVYQLVVKSGTRYLIKPEKVMVYQDSKLNGPEISWNPKGDSLLITAGDSRQVYQLTLGHKKIDKRYIGDHVWAGFTMNAPHKVFVVPGVQKGKMSPKEVLWTPATVVAKGPQVLKFGPGVSGEIQQVLYVTPQEQYILTEDGFLFYVRDNKKIKNIASFVTGMVLSEDGRSFYLQTQDNGYMNLPFLSFKVDKPSKIKKSSNGPPRSKNSTSKIS